MHSPKKIVRIIKSIAAGEIFKACPEVKQYLWSAGNSGISVILSTQLAQMETNK
jgi:hypothetical protein